MSDQRLLPCPFCGDTELEGGKPFPSDRNNSEWIIRCGQEFCGAEIRFKRKEHAIAAWNFRKPEHLEDAEKRVKELERNNSIMAEQLKKREGFWLAPDLPDKEMMDVFFEKYYAKCVPGEMNPGWEAYKAMKDSWLERNK